MNLSAVDKYALARALQGLPPVDQVGVSPLAQLMVARLAESEVGTEDIVQARRWFGQRLIEEVFKVDPHGKPPGASKNGGDHVPPLPEAACLADEDVRAARSVGKWLDVYEGWIRQRATMTDPLFLQSGGLWLLSLAVARRTVLRLDFGDIYPCLYVLWVAGTTYWRKSTGLRAIERVARDVMPELLLAAQLTPEMLLHRLAGKMPANYDDLPPFEQAREMRGQVFAGQRGFMADEASKLFAKKYMEGLPEVLMEMYDNPPVVEQEFKTQGKLVVYNPGLSLLFATTPARLSAVFGDGEWEDGLLPRFALLTPTRMVVKRTHAKRRGEHHKAPTMLKGGLRAVYDDLPMPAQPAMEDEPPAMRMAEVKITDGALERFNLYADALHEFTGPDGGLDERLTGVYGRLPVMALKVAQLLAVSDKATGAAEAYVITRAHWARAQGITEAYRASSHRLLTVLNRSADQKNEDRVLDYLRQNHAKPPTMFQIYRGTRISQRRDAYGAVTALVDAGKVAKMEMNNSTGYVIVEDD